MHPVLFETSHFTIYSYGVCVALAVTLAWALTVRLARGGSYPVGQATDLLFVAFAGGLAGARFFYVLQHPGEYAGRWHAVFFLQEGGLVWYGGFLGAVACAALTARLRGLPILPWADLFAPVIPLAHAVGRVGCYLNGCCFGKAGLPVQLYEAGLLVALSLFLIAIFFRRTKNGEVFGYYLAGYGQLRFALEFLRGDQPVWFVLTLAQWISLLLIGAGLWLLARART
jgi:phosphatidylglycerol:prolipoprotein diacylglycerol transferase